MAHADHAPGLILQTVSHHSLRAAVDPGKKCGTVRAKTVFQYAERALGPSAGNQRGIWRAGREGKFDGMDHALHVEKIDFRIPFRIETEKPYPHGCVAVAPPFVVDPRAQFRGNIRKRVETVAESVDVHHGASAHHGIIALPEHPVKNAERVCLEACGTIVFLQTKHSRQMMLHRGKLGGRGSGGRYRDVAIDLSAVGGNDSGGESPGYVDSKGRLPGGCRPCYYYNCLFQLPGTYI